MMIFVALVLTCFIAGAVVRTENLQGEWHGAIEIKNDAPLRLALHINGSGGLFDVAIDSVDEGGSGLHVDAFRFQGSTVKFSIDAVGGSYQGKVTRDGSSIDGSWTQSGVTLPLKWERGPDPANLLEPISKAEALKEGRRCVRLFHDGALSQVWSKLSPVAKQEFVSQTKIEELRDQVQKRFGTKAENIGEKVQRVGVLQIYQRLEKFHDSPDTLQLHLAFNPAGEIAEFILSDAQR